MKTVVGLFPSYVDADITVSQLERLGYSRENMNVVAPRRVVQEREEPSEVTEGAAGGATLGGLAGLLFGLTTLVVPGIGPVVATIGILSSTAVGAGVGATAGGIIGALVDLGVPEPEARKYVNELRGGNIVLTVSTANRDQATEVETVMQENNAIEIRERQSA